MTLDANRRGAKVRAVPPPERVQDVPQSFLASAANRRVERQRRVHVPCSGVVRDGDANRRASKLLLPPPPFAPTPRAASSSRDLSVARRRSNAVTTSPETAVNASAVSTTSKPRDSAAAAAADKPGVDANDARSTSAGAGAEARGKKSHSSYSARSPRFRGKCNGNSSNSGIGEGGSDVGSSSESHDLPRADDDAIPAGGTSSYSATHCGRGGLGDDEGIVRTVVVVVVVVVVVFAASGAAAKDASRGARRLIRLAPRRLERRHVGCEIRRERSRVFVHDGGLVERRSRYRRRTRRVVGVET